MKRPKDDFDKVVSALSRMIRTELRGAANEQYHPCYDPDRMDENIRLGKQKAAELAQIRADFEATMTGVILP